MDTLRDQLLQKHKERLRLDDEIARALFQYHAAKAELESQMQDLRLRIRYHERLPQDLVFLIGSMLSNKERDLLCETCVYWNEVFQMSRVRPTSLPPPCFYPNPSNLKVTYRNKEDNQGTLRVFSNPGSPERFAVMTYAGDETTIHTTLWNNVQTDVLHGGNVLRVNDKDTFIIKKFVCVAGISNGRSAWVLTKRHLLHGILNNPFTGLKISSSPVSFDSIMMNSTHVFLLSKTSREAMIIHKASSRVIGTFVLKAKRPIHCACVWNGWFVVSTGPRFSIFSWDKKLYSHKLDSPILAMAPHSRDMLWLFMGDVIKICHIAQTGSASLVSPSSSHK